MLFLLIKRERKKGRKKKDRKKGRKMFSLNCKNVLSANENMKICSEKKNLSFVVTSF
jgi:hypothetical protein